MIAASPLGKSDKLSMEQEWQATGWHGAFKATNFSQQKK
jgi:hypothetical protein